MNAPKLQSFGTFDRNAADAGLTRIEYIISEERFFEDLVSTYGKTFHTWQYERKDFLNGTRQHTAAIVRRR